MMLTDLEARRVLRSVAPHLGPAALVAVQAIGRFEGRYGSSFVTAEGPANNWGCIQCLHMPAPTMSRPTKLPSRTRCAPDGVEAGDVHADGTAYTACFRVYATPEDGARDLVRRLGGYGERHAAILATLGTGSADAVAHAMHATRYFELEPDAYAARIAANARSIASALGEPPLVARAWTTLGPGSVGANKKPLVLALQKRLSLAGFACEPSDGVYDAETVRVVRSFQLGAEAALRERGASEETIDSLPVPLRQDGIAGPKTARVLLAFDELTVARGATW